MNFANVKSITIPEGDVKSIAIGGVTVWEKPNPLPYDAEVEYVGSTGAQYVDTGYRPRVGDELLMRAYTWPNKASPFFACRGPDRSAAWGLNRNDSGGWCGYWRSDYQSGVGIQGMYQDTTEGWTVVRQSSQSYDLFRTNQTYTRGSSANADAVVPLFVFACNDNGAIPSPGTAYLTPQMRCAYFYAVRNGIRIVDLTPVRVGTTGYLYDRANPTGGPSGNGLYGSATSTPLVAGPDRNGGAA